ncbi:MAG TPA: gluconokinase [Terriglobales bacterium]|nr:gluconokinase [Terriglobales bacterium]
MIYIVMGVEGVGKTTIGIALAKQLGFAFEDADKYHSAANIEKMSQGIPLTDADRIPWLEGMHRMLIGYQHGSFGVVLACSALKQQYRDLLGKDLTVTWIYLKASPEAIRQRIEHRHGHYAKQDLLKSQFETLEEPTDAVIVDANRAPDEIVSDILTRIKPV